MFIYLAGYGKSCANTVLSDKSYFYHLGQLNLNKLFTYDSYSDSRLVELMKSFLQGNKEGMDIYLAGEEANKLKAIKQTDSKALVNNDNLLKPLNPPKKEKNMEIFLAGHVSGKENSKAVRSKHNRLLSSDNLKDDYALNEESLLEGKKNMDLYIAGAENEKWKEAINLSNSNALASYHYLPEHYYLNFPKKLFLDSGGYSAFTKGEVINLDEYIKFIKNYSKLITVYAQLDTIGDPKKTAEQLQYMESNGLNPLPVFHFGSDFNILKKLVKKYDYIALGGLVPHARNKPGLMKHLDQCFSIIKTNCKVHGFGMTGMDILKRYPWYSCDSTSWLGGSMRAEVYQFNPSTGQMKCKDTKNKSKACFQTIKFNDDNDKRWFQRVINNALEWQKVEKYITELWKARGIVWQD